MVAFGLKQSYMAVAAKQLHWAPVPKSGCWSTPIGKALMLDLPAEMIDGEGLPEELATETQAHFQKLINLFETNGNLQDGA